MKPTLDHVLVATDFSPASAAATEYAATLAWRVGARLHLVHVAEEPFATSGSYEWHLPDTPDRREERYRYLLSRLTKDAAELREEVTTTAEVRSGDVTQAIAQAAIDYGADLIVLGTRGRGGLRHFFGGDRAERLHRMTGRPIMTVRGTEDDSQWLAYAGRGAA
jgi:nucleotide-binding universal stress UspA family protein